MKITFHCTLTQPGTINNISNENLERRKGDWNNPNLKTYTSWLTCSGPHVGRIVTQAERVVNAINRLKVKEVVVVGHPIVCYAVALMLAQSALGFRAVHNALVDSIPTEGVQFTLTLENSHVALETEQAVTA